MTTFILRISESKKMTAARTDEERQEALFASIVDMVRGFALVASYTAPAEVRALDRCMKDGAVVRVTIGVGSAGPLGVLFQRVDTNGSIVDLLTLDAPPSSTPFTFGIR